MLDIVYLNLTGEKGSRIKVRFDRVDGITETDGGKTIVHTPSGSFAVKEAGADVLSDIAEAIAHVDSSRVEREARALALREQRRRYGVPLDVEFERADRERTQRQAFDAATNDEPPELAPAKPSRKKAAE